MECTADARNTGQAESHRNMHVQIQHICICIAIAFCRSSRATWVADSTLPSIPYSSHQRGLQQVPGCSSPAWQCGLSAGQRMQLSDSVHATVLAGNCTALYTSPGLWQCESTLVQGDVIAAVQQGSCSFSCADPLQHLCTLPSTPAPAPGVFLLCIAWSWMYTLSANKEGLSP